MPALQPCPARSGRCPAPPCGRLRPLGVLLGLLFSLFALLSAGGPPARALAVSNTYQVTTLADDGAGSLRAAINSANGNSGSTITFKPGLSGTIQLASGLPALGANMTIQGPGAAVLAVDGQHAVRPFFVNYGGTAALSGLTIQNGNAGDAGYGGGVYVFGAAKLTLTGCALNGNNAGYGGGVYNAGTARLTACTLTGNSAGSGGGIDNEDNLTLTACTLTGNRATVGGGVLNGAYGHMLLFDDILYGDTAFYSNEVNNQGGDVLIKYCDIAGADPLFVNAASGDLHLKAGSPCIHVGSALPPGTTDLDGTPYGSPSPSLGAYEYGLYTVTNTNDDGTGSLRAAIILADAHSGSAITFKSGLSGTILLGSALPALTANMTITGPGASVIAVDGAGAYQPFSVNSGVTALSGLTIQNGGSNTGGGVKNYDTLTLTGCTLTGNNAPFGGGIENLGRLTLTGCTLTQNSATYGGGVLNAGTLTLTGCTLTGNRAQDNGGGIYNNPYGTLTLTDDILYGDSAPAGSEISGTVTASHCDIQQAGYAGSNGNLNADPRLASLGSYGGPGRTFALLPGSPCLGAGADAGLVADSRGVAVPQNGRYDIGAFESRGFTVTLTGGGGQSATVGKAFALSLTATVKANDPAHLEPVGGGVLTFTGPATGASAAVGPAPVGSGGAVSATATASAAAGSYSVLADTGAGSASYGLSNTQAATSMALTSSLNPSLFGQAVTFKATVSGGVSPGGTVTFTIDDAAGSPVALGGGAATYAAPGLSIGAHTVTAAYSGDANNAGGTSGTLTQTVSAVAVDVSASVTVTQGSYGRVPRTTTIVQKVTLTNTSTTTITGPLSLVLDGLTTGVTLAGATGTTTSASGGAAGSPYLNIVGDLAPGASVSVSVRYADPKLALIQYTARVLAGPGSR